MKLTPKQKKFCELYAGNGGNGTEAAKQAGYKNPRVIAAQNLTKLVIVDYVKSLTKKDTDKRIATAAERKEFWTSVLLGEEVDVDSEGNKVPSKMSDRIRASELLGKSQMDFVEKRIVGGDPDNPVKVFSEIEYTVIDK